jgi:hypothetical protein
MPSSFGRLCIPQRIFIVLILVLVLILSLVLLALPATAQPPLPVPSAGLRSPVVPAESARSSITPRSLTPTSLTHSSGYIFSGTVKAVEGVATGDRDGNSVPTMQITFQVAKAIRGVRSGQTLVVREWAGMWQSGERFQLGERVLLFLYPPSKLGLTSIVGGAMGRFPVDPGGRIIIDPRRINPGIINPGIIDPGRIDPAANGHGRILVDPRDFARAFGLAIEE